MLGFLTELICAPGSYNIIVYCSNCVPGFSFVLHGLIITCRAGHLAQILYIIGLTIIHMKYWHWLMVDNRIHQLICLIKSYLPSVTIEVGESGMTQETEKSRFDYYNHWLIFWPEFQQKRIMIWTSYHNGMATPMRAGQGSQPHLIEQHELKLSFHITPLCLCSIFWYQPTSGLSSSLTAFLCLFAFVFLARILNLLLATKNVQTMSI